MFICSSFVENKIDQRPLYDHRIVGVLEVYFISQKITVDNIHMIILHSIADMQAMEQFIKQLIIYLMDNLIRVFIRHAIPATINMKCKYHLVLQDDML